MTSTPQPTPAAEMEEVFGRLTECIVFLVDEGYGYTAEKLMEVRDEFRTLQKEHAAMKEWLEQFYKDVRSNGYVFANDTPSAFGEHQYHPVIPWFNSAKKLLSSLSELSSPKSE